MNREMRRLAQKEEERARKRRQEGTRTKRERTPFRQFVREVRQELKRVAWPTRQETVTFSLVVLIVTGFVTALTFGLDFAFKESVLRFLESV
ncbi:MAG TPA: preprotein translocase subunit SecE [Acidimicrobiia bacterium]